MELWIRSQDKRMLINTKRIDVDDTDIITWDEGRYASEVYCGHYKTQERALEVLGEIQEKLNILNIENPSAPFIAIRDTVPAIYEMPEE